MNAATKYTRWTAHATGFTDRFTGHRTYWMGCVQ